MFQSVPVDNMHDAMNIVMLWVITFIMAPMVFYTARAFRDGTPKS
jgi:hypothetical protein